MNTVEKIIKIVGEHNLKTNHFLAEYTSFKIGGPADYYITPEKEEEILGLINLSKEENISYFILGKGSNILISDYGYRGMIINLSEKFNKIEVNGDMIFAQSGANLSDVSKLALEKSLTGLEFAIGIPGSLGGAIFMNAGAYGGEMSNIIHEVKVIREGKIQTITKEEMEFGYRKSTFQYKHDIILSGLLKLKSGIFEEIKAEMDDLTFKREDKQPLEYPSAGSVFKRPEGYFAGKLIQDCQLRGATVGKAQVSEKHCGFIINTGGATAEDVKELIEQIQKTVKEKFGVELEREIKYL